MKYALELCCGVMVTVSILALTLMQRRKKKRLCKTISVFDWNILAPLWYNLDEYKDINGDLNLLHPDKRLLLVIKRIFDSDADVVNLQEVQECQYQVLCNDLCQKYETLGLCKHDEKYWSEWIPENREISGNGQATFYRKGMFKVLNKIDLRTTDDGNNTLISTLQFLNSNHCVTIVNCHLESGMKEWKHKARSEQIKKIHNEVMLAMKSIEDRGMETNVICAGDLNTYGNQLGMEEARKHGFVDVNEFLGDDIKPTFIVVMPEKGQRREIQLDHFLLLKSQVRRKAITIKRFIVPNIKSKEYDAHNHTEVILQALSERLTRLQMKYEEALLNPEMIAIIGHIPSSPADFEESDPLRALRIGSDHLPLYAEFKLNYTEH